ncbi:MAG: UvrD-helicase domain-containing protein [Planctomycetota bacterium]|nr:UvrD-helicase domain-containing protein [Planctomycetota bacterium]
MSRPDLSPTQAAAVTHGFRDACVTAGAGSGKTRVLAERYVHLVRTRNLRVRDVAALTFTEKAAAEMRERIARYFEAEGLEQARADVEFAPISTIHAFCARLLRLHAIEAGVDPAFALLDAGESALLREDAAELAENRLLAENPDALRAYRTLSGSQPREILMGVLDRLRGAGVHPSRIGWIQGGMVTDDAKAAIDRALPDLAAFRDHVSGEQLELMDAALADARDLVDVPETDDLEFEAFYAYQVGDAVDRLRGSRRKGYKPARVALAEAVYQLAAARLDRYGEEQGLPALRDVLVAYEHAYAELKRDRSALDFTDLELGALALLDRLAARGQRPDLAPKALLVDEFQDTNPLQARILAHLSDVAPQFSVGDPKQSIYRFRRADVSVIVRERERVGASNRHELATSYRAHPDLVDCLNGVNDVLFQDDAAGVPYEPLTAGAEFHDLVWAPMRYALIDAGPHADAGIAREREAAWIARRVQELVEAEIPRAKKTSGRTGPLDYGDIAILFRARTDIGIYERALAAADVPYLTLKGQSYLQAEEIADLLHLLRVVQNPADTFALAAVAAGPAFAATDADLLRWFRPGKDAVGAWTRMQLEAREGGAHAEAVAAIEALQREAALGLIARVVEGALDQLGLLDVALLLEGGDRRAANLRKAIELARRLDLKGERGLGDLLRHLGSLRERAVGEAEAAVGGEDDDVVRLTTVHGAKGLEYPVVFLADIGRRPVRDTPAVHIDGAGGVAIKFKDPLEGGGRKPGAYELRDAVEQRQAGEEDRRLFYVATTRAEEMLICSAWCKGANKGDGKPKDLNGWGGWLWDALGVPFDHGDTEGRVGDADLGVEVVDARDPSFVETRVGSTHASPVTATDADRDEARRLLARAAEPTAPLGDTRFVVSVSELLAFAASPGRYYQDVVLQGAQRGAAPTVEAFAPGLDPEEPAFELGAEDDVARDRRRERAATFDEPWDGGVDRAAIGRAVHAVIERLGADGDAGLEAALGHALEEEFPAGAPDAVERAVREMVARYSRSDVGRAMHQALGKAGDVRRELDFHARVRFPGGKPVAGFDSLLVKGSIDLWLPTADGVRVVDHKTNRKSERFQSPDDLAAYYGWQLRLYALAAERIQGTDVAGASLLLLDPSWGDEAVDVPIDVSGDALKAARELCRAFAIAELEGRYPEDWRTLLA